MTRAALLAAGLLTFAACSSGSDADPPPPLETEAPTTTTEPAPTTEAPETTTTEAPETTPPPAEETTTTTVATTEPPTTDPVGTVAVDRDAVFEESFSAYETAWATRRAAIRQPTNAELRAAVNDLYIQNERLDQVNAFLDSRADAADQILEDPASPSSVDFLEGVQVTTDGEIAQFLVCETLRDDVVDAEGLTTFSENVSYRNQVIMELVEGAWKVQSESTDQEFENSETCL